MSDDNFENHNQDTAGEADGEGEEGMSSLKGGILCS